MYSLDRALTRIWERKMAFFGVFFVVVTLTYAILFIIDFIPEPVTTEAEAAEMLSEETVDTSAEEVAAATATNETEPMAVVDPLPTKIIIEKLKKEVTVLNPASREIPDLDAALLNGVVRHPDSADFSEPGNIFILGHSSYLPNVFNKNFQAFNGLQNLTWGDTIRVQSGDTEYTYFVEEVYEAAASEVIVPHTPGKARLTLATCNTFGSKEDRFIVEAKLVSERAL